MCCSVCLRTNKGKSCAEYGPKRGVCVCVYVCTSSSLGSVGGEEN